MHVILKLHWFEILRIKIDSRDEIRKIEFMMSFMRIVVLSLNWDLVYYYAVYHSWIGFVQTNRILSIEQRNRFMDILANNEQYCVFVLRTD